MRRRDSNLGRAKHFLRRVVLVTVGRVGGAMVRVGGLCTAHRSDVLVLRTAGLAPDTYLALGDVPELFVGSHEST